MLSPNSEFRIPNSKRWLGLTAMVAVTAVWGYSFLLVHEAVAVYPVFPFLALRFTLAAAILAPFLLRRTARAGGAALLGGFWMGLALFGGYAFQTWGLTLTTAAHGGFITGLFVVLAPLLEGVVTRKWAGLASWGAVVIATAGLGLLSWTGDAGGFNLGDLLSLACAGVYAVHLVLTSVMAQKHDTGALVFSQITTVAVLSWAFAALTGGAPWPVPDRAWVAIVVTALFATCLAYYVQTAYQRTATALQTAVIFTLEPVFAGLFAVLLGGELLGWRGLAGGALIVVAMFVGQAAAIRRGRT